MSLEPRWTSTMFAVYTFAGLFLAGIAAIALVVVRLRPDAARWRRPSTGSHLHDLGKLLFAFSIFWAYIWVCQYLLIWYGNLSEEIPYYAVRTRGAGCRSSRWCRCSLAGALPRPAAARGEAQSARCSPGVAVVVLRGAGSTST